MTYGIVVPLILGLVWGLWAGIALASELGRRKQRPQRLKTTPWNPLDHMTPEEYAFLRGEAAERLRVIAYLRECYHSGIAVEWTPAAKSALELAARAIERDEHDR